MEKTIVATVMYSYQVTEETYARSSLMKTFQKNTTLEEIFSWVKSVNADELTISIREIE